MSDCIKQQKEVYKGTPANRCINREASLFLEIVEPSQCDACPVKVLMKGKPLPCDQKKKVPEVMDHTENFPMCPFRFKGVGGQHTCSITGLLVDEEICGRCDEETREHEAKFGDKVKNYFGAVRRWVAQGRPTRSPEEIKEVFEEHCRGCDRYDADKHACKNCGCAVTEDSDPLKNKLAMASEHCPLGRF